MSPPTADQPLDDDESRGVGRIILVGLFVFFVGALLVGPELAGKIFPRAMAVPFVLGGWLPFLSFLGSLGRRFRAPLIAGAAAAIALVTLLLGDNHSIRRNS